MATEEIEDGFDGLDTWPSDAVVRALTEDQARAGAAVAPQIAALARAADAAAARLAGGAGRLVYVGAGTSGRVAAQDGVELAPTFDWPEGRLLVLLAGGERAMLTSVEGAEDDEEAGAELITQARIGAADVVIGVAASGRTPFTLAALTAATAAGALTVGMANNPETPLLGAARHPILLDTGPEVIAGSTRMKAGTAQKIALNALSTAIMIRLGRVYRGQMVAMRASNVKLRARAVRMVAELAGVGPDLAATALSEAGDRIKPAVLIARGASCAEAQRLLEAAGDDLREALAARESRGAP